MKLAHLTLITRPGPSVSPYMGKWDMEQITNTDGVHRAVLPGFESASLFVREKIDRAEKERMELACLRETMLHVRAFCHDFSQPLMLISGYTELMEMSPPPEAWEHLEEFQVQIEKINQLYKKLRNAILSCRQKIKSIEKD